MKIIKSFFLGICLVFFCSLSLAEEISNYADCDVCHGAIHFTPEEAKALLGSEGLQRAANIQAFNVVKIDLDGVFKNGSKESPDIGFEIKIWGQNPIFIKDLRDGSLIMVETSRQSASAVDPMASYSPHIYLESAEGDAIDLTDSLEVAWIKMKHTNIYQWVGQTKNREEWLALLRKKIYRAMEMLGK